MQTQDRPSTSSRFIVLFLLAITLCSFAGVLRCGFVNFDDPSYITDNLFVRAGLTPRTITWALTHRVQDLYHPLTELSFALDADMFGMEPAGFHLENLMLHCANVVLLYLLLQRTTGATWRSALVAAFWSVHPLRVESVAWITERKDVLMAFFGLLSLRMYVEYVSKPCARRYLLMCLLLALSLLAKPTLMVMPLLLLIMDFWPLKRTNLWSDGNGAQPWWALIREKIPVAALCAIIVSLSLGSSFDNTPPPNAAGAITLLHRFENALVAYAQYALVMFDFRKLAVFYPIPQVWPPWMLVASACFLLLMSWIAVRNRALPWILMGWLWFIVLLLPVSGIVHVNNYSLADRYSYLSSIGLLIAACWSLPDWLVLRRGRRLLLSSAVAAILFLLGWTTATYINVWKDSISLWRQALDVTRDNWLAECNYALAIDGEGQHAEAMPHFLAAVRLNPLSAQAHYDYAGALERQGDLRDAVAEYRKAIDLFPRYAQASLAAGTLLMQTSQFVAAADVFQSAARFDSKFVTAAHFCQGTVLLQHARAKESITEFRQALAAEPDYLMAHLGLGVALLRTGSPIDAAREFEAADRLKPNDPTIENNLRTAIHAASTQAGARSTSPTALK